MARPKTKGKRTKSGQLSRSLEAMVDRIPPSLHVIERRHLFAWAKPQARKGEGRSERTGEIDQDVCDGIGQLQILGLLDGHGFEPIDLRDAGRFYGEHYWTRYRETGPKTGKFERADRSVSAYLGETKDDRKFDRMDEALKGYERGILHTLVVDQCWGDEIVCWAQALIDDALGLKHKFRRGPIRFSVDEDRARLAACIRALCIICDASLGNRWERAAA